MPACLPRCPLCCLLQVIPFLQVYAVLPCSLLFLLLYSVASQTLSRHALFQATLTCFMAFFALFALFLYPRHDDLHLNALADVMAKVSKRLAGCSAVARQGAGAGAAQGREGVAKGGTSGCSCGTWQTLDDRLELQGTSTGHRVAVPGHRSTHVLCTHHQRLWPGS